MNIEEFTVEDLILAAIKSELESHEVYTTLAKRVENAYLRDRLLFLANEEIKHRFFLEDLYRKEVPGKEIVIPSQSPVPVPLIIVDPGTVHVSEVIEKAMGAEKAAYEFYMSMADRFEKKAIQKRLKFLARMELGHHALLEHELATINEFEDYIVNWPMMHLGP